jgi:hypothetical protein
MAAAKEAVAVVPQETGDAGRRRRASVLRVVAVRPEAADTILSLIA